MGGHIITRDDGRRFHIGGRRLPAVPHGIRLHDSKYGLNLSKWPTTPTSTSYGKAPAAQPVLTDSLGNDSLGNCTEADQFHRQALRQAAGGRAVYHPTLAEVIAIYSRDGGYVAGNPETDQGCDEVTVMQNAQAKGIPSGSNMIDLIEGFVLIDATNRDLVRACVSLFVGGSICAALADAWIKPFPSGLGWTWDVPSGGFVPNPSNGHCFTLGDQSDAALQCWSWGMPFTLTYDGLAACAVQSTGGALYIALDRQILDAASQKAPDGLDWAALIADFDDAGGAATPPAPTPTPSPSASVTLAQVQGWIAQGIGAGDPLDTREQAIELAQQSVAQNWPGAQRPAA